MAVVPMSRVSIYGLSKDRKAVLEALQRLGVMEIADIEHEGYSDIDTAPMQATFAKAAETAGRAIEILNVHVPEKTSLTDMFKGKKELEAKDYYGYVGEIDKIMQVAGEIVQFSKNAAEKKADVAKLQSRIETLAPWEALDIPLGFKGTRKTVVYIGSVQNIRTIEEFIEKLEFTDADAELISVSPEQTCVAVVCSKEDTAELEIRLREIGFAKAPVSSEGLPSEEIAKLRAEIDAINKEADECADKIAGYSEYRDSLKFACDYYNMRIEKYEALGKTGIGKKTFAVSGYVPENLAEDIAARLEKKYNAAVEISPDDGNSPVLLKNNGFAEPVEGVVESFSMPGRNDCDPTGVMAIFYYILFGIMLADFGYGLIMALACGILVKKFPDMEKNLKRSLKMFGYCGVSTAFWGLMFGGCFGDAVTVISTTFFGTTVNFPTLLFNPMDEIMSMLLLSFGIGVAHLFTGLFLKLWYNIRHGAVLDGIYDTVFWYFLVGGLIALLLSTSAAADILGITPIPAIAGKVGTVLAIIGAIGIILFAGRSSKNPGKRIAKGLYELYGVTSYLSDILSYSRLLALGLASGVIAQVFNRMGSMAGGGVLGAIVFILVFVVGHTLNIGINLLGTYVHTNRLQFVEFFGKFYEGGGRLYKPLSENTKYFNVTEDLKL